MSGDGGSAAVVWISKPDLVVSPFKPRDISTVQLHVEVCSCLELVALNPTASYECSVTWLAIAQTGCCI